MHMHKAKFGPFFDEPTLEGRPDCNTVDVEKEHSCALIRKTR